MRGNVEFFGIFVFERLDVLLFLFVGMLVYFIMFIMLFVEGLMKYEFFLLKLEVIFIVLVNENNYIE